jgi:hypothetical protein
VRGPLSLILEGIHEDKIIENNNRDENTSLCEPAGLTEGI